VEALGVLTGLLKALVALKVESHLLFLEPGGQVAELPGRAPGHQVVPG